MVFNLGGLPPIDDGFEDTVYYYGWQCHRCNAVTSINEWTLAWNDDTPELCQNEDCKHQRCDSCSDANGTVWPLQQCDVVTAQGSNELDLSEEEGNAEGSEVMEATALEVLGELNNADPSEAMNAAILEDFFSEADTLDASTAIQYAMMGEISGQIGTQEASEVMDNATFNDILGELDSLTPSEAMEAAIFEQFLGRVGDLEIPEVIEGTIDDVVDSEEASETTETTVMSSLLGSPARVFGRMFSCPFKDSHGCKRTFSSLGYAKNHSKVHSHHIRCHFKSCRSRFETQNSLELHMNKSHRLQEIADLDRSFKGRLRQNDGKYNCRFRELLGCEKTFSQNGHANRHALLHCKEAIPCNVRGCRKKSMKRENWEAHFWATHHQVLD